MLGDRSHQRRGGHWSALLGHSRVSTREARDASLMKLSHLSAHLRVCEMGRWEGRPGPKAQCVSRTHSSPQRVCSARIKGKSEGLFTSSPAQRRCRRWPGCPLALCCRACTQQDGGGSGGSRLLPGRLPGFLSTQTRFLLKHTRILLAAPKSSLPATAKPGCLSIPTSQGN